MFSCEVCETLKNTFFIEHLRTAASGSCKHSIWTCHEIKDVDSTEFFRKMKLAPLVFNGFAQVFYVLFRSKHWTSLGSCSHYVLIVKSCAFFFFFFFFVLFRNTRSAKYYLEAAPVICSLWNTKCPENLWTTEAIVWTRFVKKVFIKISKNSQEKTCVRVPFW